MENNEVKFFAKTSPLCNNCNRPTPVTLVGSSITHDENFKTENVEATFTCSECKNYFTIYRSKSNVYKYATKEMV